MPRSCADAAVACQERRIERLRKGNINRIVGREIVPQFPDTRQQDVVRIAMHGECQKIRQRLVSPIRAEVAADGISSKHLGDFQVQQMRRVE